ncbi:alpha/beta fold hydrolase [Pseudahrensia aquimaris]|uniref:Alpha/beta fold hydrolase n=1 Tax=Pseudahrensia aquimaris TaxID=744461 RepID=A0ABW3FG65_9HYPH
MALNFEKTERFPANAKVSEVFVERTPFAVSMRDAVQLRGFRYRVRNGGNKRNHLPVLCIPSDLGNAMEFDRFARQLLMQENGPTALYSVSLRGRGGSDAGSVATYSPLIAAEDIISVCDALNVHEVALLANAGGALPALLMAPKRPALIEKLILNDAAPERDDVGIARVRTLAKNHTPAKTLEDAIQREKDMLGSMFPAFGEPDWREKVEAAWHDGEKLTAEPAYDAALARYFDSMNFEDRQPLLWDEFKIFAARPVMALRGEKSQLITQRIIDKMRDICPTLLERVVAGQGHFPLLTKDDLAVEIAAFLHS